MKHKSLIAVGCCVLQIVWAMASLNAAKASEFSNAWHDSNSSIVLDAYEYTPIDWSKMSNNKRLAAFINKASDGLSPRASCGGNPLCRVTWRRYSAAKELYHTRKVLAKTLGMKWGAYHLARPGNPIRQAEHFLSFARPDKDDLIALDIEHNDPRRWMSLSDAEIFARHIKKRVGRYPVLYTNHSTSKFIAANRDKYPLLSRLNLWYARYKNSIPGVFPMGNWDSYTIWQFSSMVNCSDRSCPWRINGAGNWIDVNVVAMSPEKLKKAWPFAKLLAKKRPTQPKAQLLVSSKSEAKPGKPVQVTSNEVSIESVAHAYAAFVPIKIVSPTWRPNANIVKRQQYRTSDMVIASLRKQDSLPSYKLSDQFKSGSVFPVEQVVYRAQTNSHAYDFPSGI